MKTPVEQCNDALRIMGLRTDCTSLTKPISASDKVFAAYYDQVRRKTLKLVRPRFAVVNNYNLLPTPVDPNLPDRGTEYVIPKDCLYIQTINDHTEFTIANNRIIITGYPLVNNLRLNYIRDVVDTLQWTDEFDELMSAMLAKKGAPFLTKDSTAITNSNNVAQQALAEYNTLNMRDTKIKKKHHRLEKQMWPFPFRY